MVEICRGCLGAFEASSIQTHPYLGAHSGCWQIYTDILAKEFNDPDYFIVHRITVDSYAAQHIGDQTDRRARQSANVHIIALYLMFDQQKNIQEILRFMRLATEKKRDWPLVVEKKNPQWFTVHDVTSASNATSHQLFVKRWGQSVWDEYQKDKVQIIELYNKVISRS